MERPAHALEHAIPARHIAPHDGAWIAAHQNVGTDGKPICGVTWWWVEKTGNPCVMEADFARDLKAYDMEGTNLDMFVEDSVPDLFELAMRADTPKPWLDEAVPAMLASPDLDAMTKLRLAARWAEARA